MLQPATNIKAPENNFLDYSKNLNNVDSLLAELSEEKETFETAQQASDTFSDESQNNPPQYDPTGTLSTGPANVQMSEQDKRNNGKAVAIMVDDGIGLGAGLIAKNIKEADKYKASPGDLETLKEYWGEYLKDKNFAVPPWFLLLQKNIFVYGPKLFEATQDRKLAEVKADIKKANERISKLEKEAILKAETEEKTL